MSWRPEEWNNPYQDKRECWERLCFEAGADAIAKALVEWLEGHKIYRYCLIGGGRKEDTFDIWISCEELQALKKEVGIES